MKLIERLRTTTDRLGYAKDKFNRNHPVASAFVCGVAGVALLGLTSEASNAMVNSEMGRRVNDRVNDYVGDNVVPPLNKAACALGVTALCLQPQTELIPFGPYDRSPGHDRMGPTVIPAPYRFPSPNPSQQTA